MANLEKKIYLAGPEVFFPKEINESIVQRKKEILASSGLIGIDPLDNQIDFPEGISPHEMGFLIYEANRKVMDECHGCIANLTPFRGPSADAGTIYEVGYMVSQIKPVIGFTMSPGNYESRIHPVSFRDKNEMEIERFGFCDNLMIECGIVNNGGRIFRGGMETPFDELRPIDYFNELLFYKSAVAIKDALEKT